MYVCMYIRLYLYIQIVYIILYILYCTYFCICMSIDCIYLYIYLSLNWLSWVNKEKNCFRQPVASGSLLRIMDSINLLSKSFCFSGSRVYIYVLILHIYSSKTNDFASPDSFPAATFENARQVCKYLAWPETQTVLCIKCFHIQSQQHFKRKPAVLLLALSFLSCFSSGY